MPHRLTGLVWRHELVGIFEALRPELIAVKDIVYEVHLQRFFERDGTPGGHELNGARSTHQAREPLGAAGAWENPQIDLWQTDAPGVAAGDAEIACHGDLQSASDGVTIQGGDHELRSLLQAQQRFIGMQTEIIL